MSVKLNELQVTALARFNRSYAVKSLLLEEHTNGESWVHVTATLKAGGSTFDKSFILNEEGKLAKENQNAGNTADAEHISQ